MPEQIAPPFDDEVKFFSVPLKLSPIAHAKVAAFMEQTGLNKAKAYSALLEMAHASYANDQTTAAKWRAYAEQLTAAKAKKA